MSDQADVSDATSENLRNNATPADELPERETVFDKADAFRQLAPGESISVHRLSPVQAQGYLDHIVVAEGEELDVLAELKRNWGGGRYQLKAKKRVANGRILFSGLNGTFTIAGEPMQDGKVLRNGRWVDMEPERPASNQPQVIYANPPAAPQNSNLDPVSARILGLVEQQLSASQSNGGNASQAMDIVGLVGALRDTLQPAAAGRAADPYKDLERTLGLITTLKETFGGADGGGSNSDEGGGMTGLGSNVEAILLQKIMGGGAPSQPQPQPWQQPTQQWMQGQWGGPPPGAMPGQPPMGNPSGPGNWPNAQGPVGWQQSPPPHQGVPGQPRPPQNPQPPQPPPPQAAPQPQSPEPPPADEPIDDQDEDSEEDEGPFTVANLMGELEEMTPDQRSAFLAEAMSELGLDEMIGRQMFPNGMPTAITQNAAGEPIPDFTGLQKVVGSDNT